MRLKYHNIIYRWSFKKFALNFLVISMVTTVSFWYLASVTKADTRKPLLLTVQKGETLWTIAETIAPNDDPRLVVMMLKDLNKLNNSCIRTGQRIRIDI